MIKDDPSVVKPTYETLKKAFATGKTKNLEFRRQQLSRLLQGMKELEKEFHVALNKDLGASEFFSWLVSTSISMAEIENNLDNFKTWAKKRCQDTPFAIGPAKSYIVPEPYGTILVIGAWNYPIYTTMTYVSACIAAGNCVALKPSEMSPATAKVMEDLFARYLDNDCYKVIQGAGKVAELTTSLAWDMIIFTGSPEKGKLVAKAAANNLTPCVLELGGKSPTIVDEGADLDNAAMRIAQGRFFNCGQTCVAPDYLLVHKNIKAAFIEKLKARVVEFWGKDPKASPDYQRIVNEFHTERLLGYLKENHGGTVVLGGADQVDVRDKYFPPTLVDKPDLKSKLMQEEIFGPILPILEMNSIDDAIDFINLRPKALVVYYYGGVFSKNKDRIINETSSGAVSFNESLFHTLNDALPFGGVGHSGTGKLHGAKGFEVVSHMKPVFDKAPLNSFPYNARYPPFTKSKQGLLKFMLKNTNFAQRKAAIGLLFIAVFVFGFVAYRRGFVNTAAEYGLKMVQSALQRIQKH
jgi:aldehyde dehydrogenase (NAD+)